MPRIYDSSYLTQRKAEKAAASSFYTPANGSTVPWGSRPLLGNKDSSILYAVKNGAMTEYTRFDTCVGISPGCPCLQLNATIGTANPAIPGPITDITFTVGSVIVSWQAPLGNGPFSYIITPYLNGIALPSVTTTALSYRFTALDEMQHYTFGVCAVNNAGSGPVMQSAPFMAPPAILSTILMGAAPMVDISSCLIYVMNAGLNTVLTYDASKNYGATIASRFMYLWIASVVQGWNWITSDSRVSGVHDNWDWTANVSQHPLNECDSIVWLAQVIDYVTPFFVPGYTSIYTYDSATVARIQTAGNWSGWQNAWNAWYTYRQSDGSVAATSAMPTSSSNWNNTIVVDGQTVTNISGFPQPQEWTRLTVQGKKQGYLTYSWDSVQTTCLTPFEEQDILHSVSPLTGAARDAEVDQVIQMTGTLTDTQKVQAEFWAGSAVGTIAPPLMSIWLLKEYVRSIGATCSTVMYSLLDLAVHMFEGARVTWLIKSTYMQDRPIQEVRRRYQGTQVASWNGIVDGSQWIPYQRANFVTPPFADFNSGHSHFTKLFSLTMQKWFGPNIVKNSITYDNLSLMAPLFTSNQTNAYGDFLVAVGSSAIEPGVIPIAPVTLSFSTWEDIALSAGMSRLYGGIHTLTSHTTSQTTAIQVDSYVNTMWNMAVATPIPVTIGQSYVPDVTPDTDAQTISDWIAANPEVVPVPEVVPEAPAPVPVPEVVPEVVPAPVPVPEVVPAPVPVPEVVPVPVPEVVPDAPAPVPEVAPSQ